ncbi:MAG TPA: hypothetical protein O0X82_01590, partial [Methanocorpusculum sp.]|nr:hypothetical protein [Methanocorpusculum sp.]
PDTTPTNILKIRKILGILGHRKFHQSTKQTIPNNKNTQNTTNKVLQKDKLEIESFRETNTKSYQTKIKKRKRSYCPAPATPPRPSS